MPSPILPDGRLCSLPIPVAKDYGLSFDDVLFDGASIKSIIEQLAHNKAWNKNFVHLDPDLRFDSRPRKAGWLPAFGQSEAAASHLVIQKVCTGDLFLFFGWFRQTINTQDGLRFAPGAPDLHVIFGWLQVGDIWPKHNGEPIPKWLRDHPHVSGNTANLKPNLIYTAKPRLEIDGLEGWPGGGMFDRFSGVRTLTEPGVGRRSKWHLPLWFFDEKPRLTYHRDAERWTRRATDVSLDSVGRGQEFVIDVGSAEEPRQWLRSIFTAA